MRILLFLVLIMRDGNVEDYDGIVVVMVVVVMVVEAAIRNKTHSKTCRVYVDDDQQ